MAWRHLLVTQREGVCEIVLNRPEKLNALGLGPESNRSEIAAAMVAADADPTVGCILLRAIGKAFCAGGDLSGAALTETPFDEHLFNAELMAFYAALRAIHKPIVVAVHGLCLGAGLGLVAQCDIAVAADDARFGLIEGRIGHPGATEIVPIVGAAWAKFLILTGEIVDAARAEQIGLVLTVLPRAGFESRAFELARRIAAMPREAAILNKASINATNEAMGKTAGRLAGRAYDTLTKSMSHRAQAPDGRRFEDILRAGGMSALKEARDGPNGLQEGWHGSGRSRRRYLRTTSARGVLLTQLGLESPLNARTRHHLVVPTRDRWKVFQIDLVSGVAPGPAEDCKIRDRKFLGEPATILKVAIHHAIEAPGLLLESRETVAPVFLVGQRDEMVNLAGHGAEAADLEHQPLHHDRLFHQR